MLKSLPRYTWNFYKVAPKATTKFTDETTYKAIKVTAKLRSKQLET